MSTSRSAPANLAFVLVEPEHEGNVGAAARALGNLGLDDLRLVGGVQLGAEARAFACGFQDLLERTVRHATLASALGDCVLAVAMVSPARHRDATAGDLRRVRPRVLAAAERGKVALVFGSEQDGLSHDDVARCCLAASLVLPSSRPTLNLAQAVLLTGYELCCAPRAAGRPQGASGSARAEVAASDPVAGTGEVEGDADPTARAFANGTRDEALATHAEVDAVLRAVDDILARLGYGEPDSPLRGRIAARCRALAARAGLSRADTQMLWGLLARLDPRSC